MAALENLRAWGAMADAAETVAAILDGRHHSPHPLQVRMSIALLWLGESERQVRAGLDESKPGSNLLAPLAGQIWDRLGRSGNERLKEAVVRASLSRGDLPPDVLQAVSGVSDDELIFLTNGIGYGSPGVRLVPQVRRVALRGSRGQPRPSSQEVLAAHYTALDGATSPIGIGADCVVAWLEKTHHVGRAGKTGVSKWAELELPCREFYWDRGRYVSRVLREYRQAARIFESAVDRFPQDAYSWHYLAWNLDRAGGSRKRVEQAYRKAIELEVDNPWWNQRFVSYLIERTRFRDATREWGDALVRVDPDGTRSESSVWLAENLHAPVASAWLNEGRIEEGGDVVRTIPSSHFDESRRVLGALLERLKDAEEADALGESVYPAGIPHDDRWHAPLALEASLHSGHTLQRWYPGRVVEIEPDIVVVFATVDADPGARRVMRKHITDTDWQDWAHGVRPKRDRFIEIGEYSDGLIRIETVRAPKPPWEDGSESPDALRYLRRTWK